MERDDNDSKHRVAGSGLGIVRTGGTSGVAAPGLERSATGDSFRPADDPYVDSLTSALAESKIPRPRSTPFARPRRPISLTDAYRMAEEEERRARTSPPVPAISAVDAASPSPAPRPWLSRHTSDEQRMHAMLVNSPPSPKHERSRSRNNSNSTNHGRKPEYRREDMASSTESLGGSVLSLASSSQEGAAGGPDDATDDIDRKLAQFERDEARREGLLSGRNGLFSKGARVSPRVAETGEALARKTSNSSLDREPAALPRPKTWGSKAKKNTGWLRRMMSSPEKAETKDPDVDWERVGRAGGSTDAVNQGSAEPTPPSSRPPSAQPENPSPNKSFRWQADDDFTARDLMVSDSPRVRVGNTKLDAIQALEREMAAREFFEPDPEPVADLPPSPPLKPNTKLDDIRSREIEILSKKAIASSRLDEIRERNSETGRSVAPDVPLRKPSPDTSGTTTPGRQRFGSHDGTVLEGEGEHIPNTPITVFRSSNHDRLAVPGDGNSNGKTQVSSEPNARSSSGHSREDSRDLLRRLARVTSLSPSPEPVAPEPTEPDARASGERLAAAADNGKSEVDKVGLRSKRSGGLKTTGAGASSKLSVEFSGLRRVRSTDSTTDKRHSMASENDPSERIEGELKLFAPLEGSDRGSVYENERPSSPELDREDEDLDATPAAKQPFKMEDIEKPTPRVIGAYVDTPATIKVDRREPSPSASKTGRLQTGADLDGDLLSLDTQKSATQSAEATSKSRPRTRTPPPLLNSVRPPTVKDDLREIQRSQHIEDSTLELDKDFEELDTTEIEKLLDLDAPSSPEPASRRMEAMGPEDDLQRMDEMNKRVVTSLLGLRNAKHGIERLEETISNAATTDPASSAKATGLRTSHTSGTCPACGHDPSSHYAHIPLPSVPRLYRYDPNFRLTPFGILTLVLAAWVLLESVFCALYCRPTEAVCAIAHLTSPGDGPCPLLMTRDPNGPYPFHALPTKLDEWLLGGRGLPLLAALSERAGDALADSWDAIVGADLTKVDPRRLDYWARYRLRRRLARRGLGFGGRVLTPEERMSWRQRLELMPDGKDRRLLEHWQAIGRAQEAELAAARKAGGGMHRGHGTAVGGRGDGGGADEGGGESMGADEDI